MIEVKNLVKEYNPKKGNVVRALDGVSIKFPEKGMVFILGKSGSGKSTLLNIIGGLDTYTSGEIIIKGKSGNNFRQSEFDSYRNTYLGFIFQEYNILNDFNVAQNIAIALQLQGQKATSEKINEILKEVDLEGYGGRKPSELSGGQKQRVAIARALVKNPEIILADEPTGALDSKTGLQVFDTLKKLSENKLIITITHDRDFAEMYGDRVIELKDGKVISDIEKYRASAEKVSEGVRITDDKIISVKKGYELTAQDVKIINEYLKNNDMIISVDEKANGDLKRFARINDEGEKESFKKTDEGKITYSEDSKFKLIKSRLPIKNMVKIGGSSLKNKPVRLVFTILLSMVAFTMFGLTDTFAAYNKYSATEKSIEDSGINVASFSIGKFEKKKYEDYEYRDEYSHTFTAADVEELQKKTGVTFRPVLQETSINPFHYAATNDNSNYYSQGISGFLEADEAYVNSLGFTVYGKMPTEVDEVALSSHYYELYKENGYKNGEKSIKPEECVTQNAFLSKEPTFLYGERELKITAIIDTKFNDEKYGNLKKKDAGGGITDFFLANEMNEDILYGYHGVLFVSKTFMEKVREDNKQNRNVYITAYTPEYDGQASFDTYYTEEEIKGEYGIVYFTGENNLSANGILLDVTNCVRFLRMIKEERNVDCATEEEILSTINNYKSYLYYKKEGYSDEDIAVMMGGILADEAYMAEYYETTIKPCLENGRYFFTDPIYTNFNVREYYSTGETYVEGYYLSYGNDDYSGQGSLVVSKEKVASIEEAVSGEYAFVVKGNPTKAEWKKLIRFAYDNEKEVSELDKGVTYSMQNSVIVTLSTLNDIVESMAKIFLYIGIGFAVFAALMLTNFISTSIVYKRREIGILRAVGARGSDVYGIFATESVIIALINFVLSCLATGIIANVITQSFRREYNLSISIIDFGLRQVGLILAVAIVVALIASFIPTFRISRQRPVDAIKK